MLHRVDKFYTSLLWPGRVYKDSRYCMIYRRILSDLFKKPTFQVRPGSTSTALQGCCSLLLRPIWMPWSDLSIQNAWIMSILCFYNEWQGPRVMINTQNRGTRLRCTKSQLTTKTGLCKCKMNVQKSITTTVLQGFHPGLRPGLWSLCWSQSAALPSYNSLWNSK